MTDVETEVRYINPEWRDRSDSPSIGSRESRRANTAHRRVTVYDGRTAEVDFDLETSGFVVTEAPFLFSPSPLPAGDRSHRREYRQAVLDYVQRQFGADETFLFGDLIRTEDQSDFNTAYARFVHCDYNPRATRGMANDLLARRGAEPEPHWQYAWYNTWQPFDHEVQQNPLAMVDLRTVADNDIIDYRYSGYSEAGDTGSLVSAPVYSPAHRWFYFSRMRPDEVLLSKQGDERDGRTVQVPHTSFIDPSQPDDVPPRRSIETRVLAVYK